jgi:Bacterial cell division membrane protein
MDLTSRLFRGDKAIWIIFMLLCLVSVVMIFSATSTIAYKKADFWDPVTTHAGFLFAGILIMFILHYIPYQVFSLGTFGLPISAILLILVMFIGEEVNEAQRAIFGFQPLELAKLTSIVFVAFMLSKKERFTDKRTFYIILISISIICLLILTQNLSTAIMLFFICYIMMFIGELSLKRMFFLTGGLILSLTLFITVLFVTPDSLIDYMPNRVRTWKARIVSFWTPKEIHTEESTFKITNANFQETHAKIAVARAGLIGHMPGHGQQRDFLPQAYSDFIYAIILEESGFIGGMSVLALYITLLIRVGVIARRCEGLFAKYLVLGCGLMVVVQAFINMAVAVGFFPVTGQPLPLISRGGTSTIMSCVYFGIILSVSRFGAGMGDEKIALEEEVIEVEESDVEEALEITAVIPEEKA